jgi:hypothetical protein
MYLFIFFMKYDNKNALTKLCIINNKFYAAGRLVRAFFEVRFVANTPTNEARSEARCRRHLGGNYNWVMEKGGAGKGQSANYEPRGRNQLCVF